MIGIEFFGNGDSDVVVYLQIKATKVWAQISLGDESDIQMLLFWLEEVPLEQELLSVCIAPGVMEFSSFTCPSDFSCILRGENELPEICFSP